MLANRLNSFLESISFFIFGHGLTSTMKEFIGNLSWSFLGGIITSAILLVVNILAGRLLGPEEYGKYNIVWAIAQIIMVFVIFGMDASNMRTMSKDTGNNTKKRSISTVFYFIIFSSSVFSIIYYLVVLNFKSVINIDQNILLMSLLLGIVLAFRQLLDSFLRALSKFKRQSFIKIVEAVIIFVTFAVLLKKIGNYDYSSYIIALVCGGIFAIGSYLFVIRKYFTMFDFKILEKRFSYAKIMFIASILGIIFGSLDKIVIAKYMSFHDLGIYSAYYTASFALAAQFMVFFDNVFFPTVARYKSDIKTILKKVDRLSLVLILPLYIAMCGVIYFIMLLFGKDYNINLFFILSFGFLAVLKMLLSVNSSLVTVHSNESLKKAIYLGNSINIIFIIIFVLILPHITISIQFMILALIFYHILLLVVVRYIFYSLKFHK